MNLWSFAGPAAGLLFAGYILQRLGAPPLVITVLNRFLLSFVIPVIVFVNIYGQKGLEALNAPFLISCLHMLVMLLITLLVGRLAFKGRWENVLAFSLSLYLPNVAFLGVPLSVTVFGSPYPVIPYVVAFNMLLPLTILAVSLVASKRFQAGLGIILAPLPSLLALASAILLRLVGLHNHTNLPLNTLERVASYSSFLSFIVLGYTMAKTSREDLNKHLGYVILGGVMRFILSPALMYIMLMFARFSLMMLEEGFVRGLLMESFMPPAVTCLAISEVFGLDLKLTSTLIVIQTPISVALVLTLFGLVM